MKKFILPVLLFPLLVGGCTLFKKKSNEESQEQNEQVVEEDHYIDVKDSEVSLIIGEQYQIEITQLKKTIILCQSSNDNVATVTQSGLVTALAQGETSITITGGKDRFIVFVSVLPDEAKDSLQIVMVKSSFTIEMGDEFTLPFVVKYGNQIVENPTFIYEYETTGIVSISGLNVTTLSAGTTRCVATASYNELSTSSSFAITVY